MKQEQFGREKDCGAALAIAKALLARGLITLAEYRRVKAALIKKYRPVMGSLRDGPAAGNPRSPK
jgi:hypothetical protein